jgi:hypothetical protein
MFIHMNPLHHDHDSAGALVIQARNDGIEEPVVRGVPF